MQNKIDQGTDLPEKIADYNATKALPDRVEQFYHNYSVWKRTKCWPLAYFYNCLKYCGYQWKNDLQNKIFTKEKEPSYQRRIIFKNLGMSLLYPWPQ